MRILLLTPFYDPDLGPSAALYRGLCEELVRLGCEVSVISAVPHYPTGRVPREYRGRLIQRENRNGVDVTRVWVPSLNRARLPLRALGFACYQLLACAAAFRRPYDVLIASNPAFEVLLPFLALTVSPRQPAVFCVHEIYPDVGVQIGIFRHAPIIRLVDWMERACFRRAECVRVLSEGYRRALEAKGVPGSKLAVIRDWTDTDVIRPLPRRNGFSARWNLENSFVVMYAGNLGPTQGLEQVVEAASRLSHEPRIRFVLVGEGAAREGLQRLVQSRGLTNVEFVPFQPRALLPLVLASADASLVTLKRGVGSHSVPSKIYAILASGRPVIAAADSGTDTADLVQRARCGLRVEPENPDELAAAILRLYRDEEYRMGLGANGRAYATSLHSRESAAPEFYKLIEPWTRLGDAWTPSLST